MQPSTPPNTNFAMIIPSSPQIFRTPHVTHVVAGANCSADLLLKDTLKNINSWQPSPSRNGPVRRAPGLFVTTYEPEFVPVMGSAIRDANPFLHYIEAFWMLCGRNDLALMKFFAAQMSEYSDDGSTLWGAYGHRWRQHFRFDQLNAIIEELRRNPTSRRCVLQMWDGYSDLPRALANGKDVPCLSGDTVLRSPEGNFTLAELERKFSRGELKSLPVYSVDFSKPMWPVVMQNCTKVWCSGTKTTFKITFADGTSVRATEDHRFFVRTRTGGHNQHGGTETSVSSVETQVRDLRVGQTLCAGVFRTVAGSKPYIKLKKQLQGNTAFSSMIPEHRFYYAHFSKRPIPEGHVVHHQDEVMTNNCRSNLVLLSESEHNSEHQHRNNRHRAMSAEDKEIRGHMHSAAIREYNDRVAKEYGPELRAALNKPVAKRTEFEQAMVEVYQEERAAAHKAKKQVKSLEGKSRQKESIKDLAKLPKSPPKTLRIVSIEECGREKVYDFTVPKLHNAMLENGVVAHNCNHVATFDTEGGRLNMTVTNRSNDLIWGTYGANMVHFNLLLTYVSAVTGIPKGNYHQVSSNTHVYMEFPITQRFLNTAGDLVSLNPAYEEEVATTYRPGAFADLFQVKDLRSSPQHVETHELFQLNRLFDQLLHHLDGSQDPLEYCRDLNDYADEILNSTVVFSAFSFCLSYVLYKKGLYANALESVETLVDSTDNPFFMEGLRWLLRRDPSQKKSGGKQ